MKTKNLNHTGSFYSLHFIIDHHAKEITLIFATVMIQ